MFGPDASTAQRPDQLASLSVEPVRPNQLSQRINNVVAQLRKDRANRPALFIIRQGDPHPHTVMMFRRILGCALLVFRSLSNSQNARGAAHDLPRSPKHHIMRF